MARTGNITITQGKQNLANATTPITVVGKITTTDGSYRGDHNPCTVVVKCGDTTIYTDTFNVGAPANTTTTLFTIDLTVEHDSNGEAGVITASYNYANGWCTAANTLVIPTISRGSTLTLANGTLGVQQGFSITRENTSFTHKIKYICGSLSGYILGSASATSSVIQNLSWAPPLTWATQEPENTEVSVVFTLETYSGSTLIGSSVYSRTFEIPDSVIPTVTITVSDPTGYQGTYGEYVKTKSKVHVVLDADGAQGSTIKSYKITANGKTYNAADITTDILTVSAGNHEITAVVTDSRGRPSATATKDISVEDYSAPRLYDVSVFRCNANGTSNPAGEYLCAKFSAEVSSLNSKNSAVYKVSYKKTSGTTRTQTLSAYDKQYSVVGGTYVFAADTGSSYEVTISVTDDFQTTPITKSGPTIRIQSCKFANGAHGISFGKYAELEDAFDVGWPGHFREGLTVYDSTGKAYSFLDFVAKFSEYLPLTGGTITGELIASNTNLAAQRTVSGSLKKLQMLIDSSTGNARFRILKAGIQQNYVDLGDNAVTVSSDINIPEDKYLNIGTGHITQDANQALKFAASNETSYRLFLGVSASTWCLCPTISGNLSLGNSSVKWKQLFATTSTISTSDRNEKLDIADLDKDLSSAFILAIPTRSFKKIDGDSGRTHWGMVSQEVWDVMQSLGISDMDFAGFIRYHKCRMEERQKVVVDEETGEETTQAYTEDVYEYDEDENPVYGYGLRYEEFIAPMIATIQKQQSELDLLKSELAEIKAKLNI